MTTKYVYKVFDTQTNKYWSSDTSSIFITPGAAKYSWYVKRNWLYKVSTFNDQSRFVIHKFELKKV